MSENENHISEACVVGVGGIRLDFLCCSCRGADWGLCVDSSSFSKRAFVVNLCPIKDILMSSFAYYLYDLI